MRLTLGDRGSGIAGDLPLRPHAPARMVHGMADPDERERFRHLPEPVLPEDSVEMVDAEARHPVSDEHEERARMLREAGGGI